MNKQNVYDLFTFLTNVYPTFDYDQEKLNTWQSLLKDQNPASVMKLAEKHALTNKFPPTIAELRGRKEREDESVLASFWEGEAK